MIAATHYSEEPFVTLETTPHPVDQLATPPNPSSCCYIDPALYTPSKCLQILSASLAESESAGYLVADGPISANQKLPGLVLESVPELEEPEWNLLERGNLPQTEVQWWVRAQKLKRNLALARQHLQVHDAIVEGSQAQLLLQGFQILHQSLNHKQNKKQTDHTKLNPGGRARYLTSDSYVEEAERVEAERSRKETEKKAKKVVSEERRIAQVEINQKWTKI